MTDLRSRVTVLRESAQTLEMLVVRATTCRDAGRVRAIREIGASSMGIVMRAAAAFVLGFATLVAAQDVTSAMHGTVKKIDASAKTVAITTEDGTEQVVHFSDKTLVHGTTVGATDTFHGLKVGSQVVVRTTGTGSKKTAVEVDNVGKDGLKVTEGTITKIDAGGKTVVVKTADGTEQTFDMTARAGEDAAKATAAGATKTGKVTVYYVDEGGKKIAHLFK
jgi:hypothetical protein